MIMDVRLIAMDMDGTLLDSQKKLTETTLRTLQKAVDRGIWIVPSTGRMVQGLQEYIKILPSLRYIIAVNGGTVWDLKENISIFDANIPYEQAMEVIEFVQKYDAVNECYCINEALMSKSSYDLIDYHIPDSLAAVVKGNRKAVDDYVGFMRGKRADVQKIQLFFHDSDKRLAAIRELEKTFPGIALTSSQPYNIELNAASVSKGNALEILCRHLNIDRQKTMAFGDGGNDRSMLLAAGYAVAMANGTDEIKTVADFVTQSNDEDGVARAIEKLILEV